MKVTRYTINGRGIFISLNCLDDVMDDEDADELHRIEEVFNRELECPPLYKGYRNWFTETGCEKFQEELEDLLWLYEKYIGKPKEQTREVDLKLSKYHDDYQILLPAGI